MPSVAGSVPSSASAGEAKVDVDGAAGATGNAPTSTGGVAGGAGATAEVEGADGGESGGEANSKPGTRSLSDLGLEPQFSLS